MSLRRMAVAAMTLALLPGVPAAAQAPAEDPHPILRALVESGTTRYKGLRSVAVWSVEGARAVEIVEMREGPHIKLEVQPTAGLSSAIMLGNSGEWRIYQPEAGRMERAEIPRVPAAARLAQAFRSYSWHLVGEDRVAGRPALVVEAAPRHPGGFRNRFWIDEGHPVVLRREKYDRDGRLIFRSAFVSIDYPSDIEDSAFEPDLQGSPPPPMEAHDDPSFAPRSPETLLPGFTRVRSSDLDPGMAGADGHHTIYSDGLESVSLFQFPGSQPVDLSSRARTQEIAGCPVRVVDAAAGNMLSWSDGRRSFLMISSLPQQSVTPAVQELAPEAPRSRGLLYYLGRGWRKLVSWFS